MITTLADVKEYLGITDESQDVKIQKLIPACERAYLEIRNANWDTDDEGLPVYPVGSDITVAEMIGYKLRTKPGENVIASESITSYSVSYGSTVTIKGWPVSIVGSIKRFTKGISPTSYTVRNEGYFDLLDGGD